MNKRISLLLAVAAVLLLASCRRGDGDNVLPLTDWQFAYAGAWHPATVPGCIHTDLMNEGLIADPYLDTNEARCAWVSDSVWTYRATFRLKAGQRRRPKHHDLVFAGLDTRAEIYLNGHLLGRADNMFRSWRFPVQEWLRRGDNELLVRFYPEARHDDSCAAAMPYSLPDKRVFTRTAPYQQGWDWGPKLNTCGIWQPVWIEGWQSAQPAGTAGGSGLKGFFGAFDDREAPAEQATDRPSCQLVRDSGAFCLVIDGQPVFMRGANWVPVHSFPVLDAAQEARYRQLLCAAKEANFNMLRVWGGGIYEPDFFYDLCDSLGLYVWQDFDFSCALYPGDEAFVRNVRTEAEEQVRRLAKHRCIVLWCGNNEVSNGWQDWGWQEQYGYTPDQQAAIVAANDKLFGDAGILAAIVRKYMPGVPYLASSPVWGWGHRESVTDGDSHYWGVWWGELPFEAYRRHTGRFMSEYGFQSYPAYSTLCRILPALSRPAADSLPAGRLLTLPALASHQKHPRGVAVIDQALQRYYGVTAMDVGLPRFVYLSQLCQAYGVGMGIEACRIRKGHCWGSLYWQLNDCWPVASWSSIDYYGNWKALHYAAQRLYAPLAVLSEPAADGRGADFYVVCDTLRDTAGCHGKLLFTLRDFSGKILRQTEQDVALTARRASAAVHYRLPDGMAAEAVVLQAQYYDEKEHVAAEKLHYFAAPRQLLLPAAAPRLDLRRWQPAKGQLTVTVQSDGLAYGVMLTTEPHVAGHFSANFFDLLPELSDEDLPRNSRTVTFIPADSADPLLQRPIRVKVTCYNP